MSAVRGDGVGIEVTESLVRGVRLDHHHPGRAVAAAELSFPAYDDAAARDAFVLLRAELGEPRSPTRIATFPSASIMQRIDVTGRSGPELNELRSKLDRLHAINSTMLQDDGPRRWLFLIRWDAVAVRRLEDLAERAGFVDVSVEPSPMAVARVLPPVASFARRAAAQAETFRVVVSGGLPVVADGHAPGLASAPGLEVSDVTVPLAWFDDFLSEPALGEQLQRVDTAAEAQAALRTVSGGAGVVLEGDAVAVADGASGVVTAAPTSPVERPAPRSSDRTLPDPTAAESDDDVHSGLSGLSEERAILQVAGLAYPPMPDSDVRSAVRQAASLGAAAGAAGLAGSLRPVDIIGPAIGTDDGFDRPWAVERMSDLPPVDEPASPSVLRRMRARLVPRRRS
ncbi:MAG: hypothetical protein AAF945_02670 [Actinomycetota bacterium]